MVQSARLFLRKFNRNVRSFFLNKKIIDACSKIFIFFILALMVPVTLNWFTDIVKWEKFKETFNRDLPIYLPTLLLAGVLLLYIIYTMYVKIIRINDDLVASENERLSLLSYVEELKESQYVDSITGIPNNLLWEEHLRKFLASPRKSAKAHVVIIDLVGFGKINREYKPHSADRVLRAVAQGLRGGMRRNEQIYRRRREKQPLGSDEFPDADIYRRYRGGDEFFIFASGTEVDAIGFLTRLHIELRTKISDEISLDIFRESRQLAFYGAICQIYENDRLDLIEARLDDLLSRAKYDGNIRLIWETLLADPDDVILSSREKKVYDDAKREFAVLEPAR